MTQYLNTLGKNVVVRSSANFGNGLAAHETENLIWIFDVYPIIRGPAISVHHPVLTVEADPAKQARE